MKFDHLLIFISPHPLPVFLIPQKKIADLLCTMFSIFMTSFQEVFNRAVSFLSETPACCVKALSAAASHYNITSTNRFGNWSPTRLLDLRKYYSRCDRCRQDEYTELVFAFLFTAIAFLAFVCINNILSYTPDPQVRPETTRSHALERAITRQIEINYHLSRLPQPLGLLRCTASQTITKNGLPFGSSSIASAFKQKQISSVALRIGATTITRILLSATMR